MSIDHLMVDGLYLLAMVVVDDLSTKVVMGPQEVVVESSRRR
jgi:hypothetical protein